MRPLLTEVQHAARYGVLLLAEHAKLRMRERKVRMGDLKHALRTVVAASAEDRGAVLVSGGADLAGDPLFVVVRLVPLGLFVVTIF